MPKNGAKEYSKSLKRTKVILSKGRRGECQKGKREARIVADT